jgi:hypothetical protein
MPPDVRKVFDLPEEAKSSFWGYAPDSDTSDLSIMDVATGKA